jgi:hypothetical protein
LKEKPILEAKEWQGKGKAAALENSKALVRVSSKGSELLF